MAWSPNDPEKQLLSWHVLTATKAAGFSRISTAMLNRFPGGDLSIIVAEPRLRVSNMRFCCAALHIGTGKVVTHTEEATSTVPRAWWAEDSRAMRSIPQPWGQKLQPATALSDSSVSNLQILILVIMLWMFAGQSTLFFVGVTTLWYVSHSPWLFYSAATILGAACIS